jgi:hypothetical protein
MEFLVQYTEFPGIPAFLMEDFAEIREIREISHGIRKIPKHKNTYGIPCRWNSVDTQLRRVMVASKFSVKLMISIVGSSDFDIFLEILYASCKIPLLLMPFAPNFEEIFFNSHKGWCYFFGGKKVK